MKKLNLFFNKKKYFKYLFLILIFFFLYILIGEKNRIKVDHWLDDNIFYRLNAAKRIIIYDKSFADKFHNSYNQKYLPETLFLNLKFETKKIDFLIQNRESFNYSFFIEVIEDEEILVTDAYGNFSYINISDSSKNFNDKNRTIIKSNLKIHETLDTFLHQDKIFISYVKKKEDCKTFGISYASFNKDYLDFKSFFENKDCKKRINGGKIQDYNFKNKDGLLFSLSATIMNEPTMEPQNESSIFGKILFQEFGSTKPIIFSKGHRVNQGLITINNLILATEHGPKGGDEINKIEFLKNYGWPISSYGVKYGDNVKKPFYKVSHDKFDFTEPLYVFMTAIGITEIIKLPDNFSDYWQNNFIVSSLNRGSIYRIKFDKNFKKLLFKEEIFIGKRIRDVKYIPKRKKIILALETRGEIGILSNE